MFPAPFMVSVHSKTVGFKSYQAEKKKKAARAGRLLETRLNVNLEEREDRRNKKAILELSRPHH